MSSALTWNARSRSEGALGSSPAQPFARTVKAKHVARG